MYKKRAVSAGPTGLDVKLDIILCRDTDRTSKAGISSPPRDLGAWKAPQPFAISIDLLQIQAKFPSAVNGPNDPTRLVDLLD